MGVRLRFAFDGVRQTFANPTHVLEARTHADVVPVLAAAEEAALAGNWVAGYVAYEAAPAFDPALRVRAVDGARLAWFGIFDGSQPAPRTDARDDDAAEAEAAWGPRIEMPSRTEYEHAVASIRAAIERGDVYQVNHTVRARGRAAPDGRGLFDRLCAAQGRGYFADLALEDQRILSISPELFFRREGRTLVTRPMKGTRPRGRWLAEDEAAAASLAGSAKDRAENVMIVDLLRNDLGRIARPGCVRVDARFALERFPTVHQMTSTISATIRDDVGLVEIFRALFPCGSVTGAPKVAAMRFIASLERSPRGAYCGAVGLLKPGGDCTFNVAIRTLSLDPATGLVEYGIGGGITWDSDGHAEYEEALSKAAVLAAKRPDFALVETMRAERGSIPRLDLHIARLVESAAYFGWPPLDVTALRRTLEARVRPSAAAEPLRVRLVVDAGGGASTAVQSLAANAIAPLDVRLVTGHVRSEDVFLFHKTTNRAVHESALASVPACDDVLLVNERGELTELSIGNLVIELDRAFLTPPREAGLLAGVLRQALLDRGSIRESTLHPADLHGASRCWRISSARGWVPIARILAADGSALFLDRSASARAASEPIGSAR